MCAGTFELPIVISIEIQMTKTNLSASILKYKFRFGQLGKSYQFGWLLKDRPKKAYTEDVAQNDRKWLRSSLRLLLLG